MNEQATEAGDEGIAAVLAKARCSDVHPDRWDYKYGVGICPACQSWAEHLAAALAPLIAEREATAWDEGYKAGGEDWDNAYWSAGYGGDTPNPYRAALAPETPEAGGA